MNEQEVFSLWATIEQATRDGDRPAEVAVRGDDFRFFPDAKACWKTYRAWIDLIEDMEGMPLETDAGIREVPFHQQWVPIAEAGNGDVLCVDLAPTEEGTPKQVIFVAHDEEYRTLVAESVLALRGAQQSG